MPVYSLARAAAAAGRSRSTVLRAIQTGRLSVERDATTGEWAIDASELARVYPPAADRHADGHADLAANGRGDSAALIAAKDAMLAEQSATIADLRRRLDVSTQQLSEALSQVRLLTDQRVQSAKSANAENAGDAKSASAENSPPAPARRGWRFWRRV